MEKVGRNDPCPCGSGKKFKKCHGKQSGNKPIQATVIQPESNPLASLFQSRMQTPTTTETSISERITPNPNTA